MDGLRKKANRGSSWNGSCIIGTRRIDPPACRQIKSKNRFLKAKSRVSLA